MPWSRTPLAIAAYALAALLAAAELGVLWLAIHPQVPPYYRAYYIDGTTTCLPQPVSGEYVLGTTIDFRSGGPDTRALRPCGWEGPAGDGVHAVGRESRLRFAAAPAPNLTLSLQMTAVTLPGPPAQRVVISVNGTEIGEAAIPAGETRAFVFSVPATILGQTGMADVELAFPDAITVRPGDSDTRRRSIKLVSARLGPAD